MPQTDSPEADARAARIELERILGNRPIHLPPGFAEAVERFVALLLAANRRINLTRVTEPAAVARLHLLDALSALPLIDGLEHGGRGLDLGSGGGVPGLVLALARPEQRWVLVDSVRKKADVLRDFVATLGIDNVEVIAERAEVLGHDPAHRESQDLVTARACATLPVLVEYALPLLSVGGTLVAWKGPISADELHAGNAAAAACGGGAPSVLPPGFDELGEHRFVVIAKGKPTPQRYPRRPGEPGRHPLGSGPVGEPSVRLGLRMRIAVLSDIHANLPALEAVAADLPPVDQVWVLGDTVGYGPQPNEVIATLQAMGARSVMGNHDGAAIGTVDPVYFNPDARAAIEWTAEVLDANARAYIATLPEMRSDGELTAVHGSPRDPIWEYITGPDVAAANFEAYETRLCLFGHTHLPLAFRAIDGEDRGDDRPAGHVGATGTGAGNAQPWQRRAATRRASGRGVCAPRP